MDSDIIKSIDRALDILLYMDDKHSEVGVSQIAEDLDIYKSTVFRTLLTLENKGFVKKNPNTDRYWLGNRLFTLGKSVESKIGLTGIIVPYIQELHKKYNEVVNVSVLEKDSEGMYRSVIIYKAENPKQILSVSPPVGSRSDCYCSAVGKSLLAFTPNIDFDKYNSSNMIKFTNNTITSKEDLVKEIEKVKKQGYSIDNEELELGLTCLGTPILDRNGEAIAAISLSGPTSRILTGNIIDKINDVVKTSKNITDNL